MEIQWLEFTIIAHHTFDTYSNVSIRQLYVYSIYACNS